MKNNSTISYFHFHSNKTLRTLEAVLRKIPYCYAWYHWDAKCS